MNNDSIRIIWQASQLTQAIIDFPEHDFVEYEISKAIGYMYAVLDYMCIHNMTNSEMNEVQIKRADKVGELEEQRRGQNG